MDKQILFLFCLLSQTHTARILAIFSFPSISHQLVFRTVTNELAKRGHELVVITTDPQYSNGKSPENFKEIDVHDISYKIWHELLMKEVLSGKFDSFSKLTGIMRSITQLFEVQTETDAVKDIIEKKNGEFDLILIETCIRPALGFSHIYKVPVIGLSSLGFAFFDDDVMGALTHPFLFPNVWHLRVYNLTVWEKLQELWIHVNVKLYYNYLEESQNAVMRKIFGNDVPSLHELYKNMQLMILNNYPLWSDNQPVPPSVVYMGGLKTTPISRLSKELENYLNSSKNGVIYMSFGTNVVPSALPKESVMAIINALSNVTYDVLLKWDSVKIPVAARNIKIGKWFPQSDVLRHPNVKLFISQGGLQSTDETIEAGVPIIALPILADQWYNAEKIVHHRIGIYLNIASITAEQLKEAINTLISDESYRNNVIKLRAVMQDQPQQPLERAMWWIEHVLRHGGAHLRPPTANLPLWNYLEMDLVLLIIILVFCAVFAVVLFLYTMYKVWKYSRRSTKKVSKRKVKRS